MGAHNPDTQMGWFIILGTMPILIAGLLFKHAIEGSLRNLWITVTVLVLFGVLLWVVDARSKQVKTMKEMTWKDALIFGIGQMLALIPGVSRSGGTITFGRAMGYTREAAVRVSFLMAIPAVFGAGILEAVSAVKDVAAGDAGMFPGWGPTIAAAIVAFVVGYVVIIGFLRTTNNKLGRPSCDDRPNLYIGNLSSAATSIAAQERFGLANQFFTCRHAIRRDTLCLSVQIVIPLQTGKIIASVRLLDNLIGILAPFCSLLIQITLDNRKLQQKRQCANQLKRALQTFRIGAIMRHGNPTQKCQEC